jgi:hypothetical protein
MKTGNVKGPIKVPPPGPSDTKDIRRTFSIGFIMNPDPAIYLDAAPDSDFLLSHEK